MRLEEIRGWRGGQYRGYGPLSLKLFPNTCKKLILFRAGKRIQASDHMPVFFRLHQIYTYQNHKNEDFLSSIVIFL